MIFAPQNVMGPAHRGGVIQQLAQGAAQNVMRRQKLKALLQHTAAQGHGAGGGQPFRSSTMGHATGMRGATFRPGAAAPFGSPGGAAMNLTAGGGMPGPNYPDAGPPDLASLPSNDPAQSPSSTQPGETHDPGSQFIDPNTGQPVQGVTWNPNPNPNVPGTAPGTNGGVFHDASPLIPLGNGHFYDPATDQITTGGGVRPGLQQ